MVRRFGIRTKIAGGSFAIALVGSIAAGFVLDARVSQILMNNTEGTLKATAAHYVEAIRNEPSEAFDAPGAGQQVAVVDPTGTPHIASLPSELMTHALDCRLPDTPHQQPDTPHQQPATTHQQPDTPHQLSDGFHELQSDAGPVILYVERVPSDAGAWCVIAAQSSPRNSLVLTQMRGLIIASLAVISYGVLIAALILTSVALHPVRRIRQTARRLIDSSGDELLPVSSVDDEIGRLARTLNELIGALRASTQREKQLVSDASHELRTPLAIMRTRLELARTHPGTVEQLVEDIRGAEASVVRMTALVESLLQLSTIEAAAPSLSTIAELRAELREAVGRAEFREKNMRFRSIAIADDDAPDRDSHATVRISAHDCGRVLDNLLANAIHATGGDGVVTVSLRTSSDMVRLSVHDNGPGMPPDFVDRAFDRFSQSDTSRAAGTGTGLGLSIVAAIVRQAQGTIEIRNSPGHGLAVAIDLPVTRPAPLPSPQP